MDFPFPSTVQQPRICSKDFSKSTEGDLAVENDQCDAVLRYANMVLMEDDFEDKPCMIPDSILHATEKSFHETLNKEYPSSSNSLLSLEDTNNSLDDSFTHYYNNCGISYSNAYMAAEAGLTGDLNKHKSSHVRNPSVYHSFLANSPLFCPPNFSCYAVDDLVDSVVNVPLENRSSWKFNKGIHESSNSLPSGSSVLSDFEKNRLIPPIAAKENVLSLEANADKDERNLPERLLRGRKSLHHEESVTEEGRRDKCFTVQGDESIFYEMFDKIVSLHGGNDESALNALDGSLHQASKASQQNGKVKGSNAKMAYTRRGASKRKAVTLRSLLMQCMQSIAGNDHSSANELLKHIRAKSSPSGDGSQRLAHYFANGLEARLKGAGSLKYDAYLIRNLSDADLLKAVKMYLSAIPSMETSYFFANEMIMELCEKATNIHIIHFGIGYGIQWPPLIQHLSTRPGRPPKLRITGVDLPQSGFQPDLIVKETGCRLANYCLRFNVPFQYNGIAKKWENVTVEDLRIEKDELLVVNCMFMSSFLLDDTLTEHSPRDAVLKLIKMISPDIFIHGVTNGTYSSHFFINRFREALFYFSSQFDMLDACVPCKNHERMVFEREILGHKILNTVACEGLERVERPETYKQWQFRTLRAGFRQLPLSQGVMEKLTAKVKSGCHKEFFVDEANQWMLLRWKGRALFASSCWKPA